MQTIIRRRRLLAVLSVVPLLYILFFAALLTWWFFAFDASRVTHPHAVVVGITLVVVAHLLIMILMLSLCFYFLSLLQRSLVIQPSEKIAWLLILVLFNVLAYPVFYLRYIHSGQLDLRP